MNEKQKVYVVVGTLKCSDISNNIAAFSTQEKAEKFMASNSKLINHFSKDSLFIDVMEIDMHDE
jgi:predicted transcriptional regulator